MDEEINKMLVDMGLSATDYPEYDFECEDDISKEDLESMKIKLQNLERWNRKKKFSK